MADVEFMVGDQIGWQNDTRSSVLHGIVVSDEGRGDGNRYSVVWAHKADQVVQSDLIDCYLIDRLPGIYLPALRRVVDHVVAERVRQENLRRSGKFAATCATIGPNQMTDAECAVVLGEEFGEACRAVAEQIPGNSEKRADLRSELVQVAAVAMAWIERLDAEAAS